MTVSALHHPRFNLRTKPHHLKKLGCNTKDYLNRGVGQTAAPEWNSWEQVLCSGTEQPGAAEYSLHS